MCYFKLSAVPFINLYKELVMTQSSDNIPDGHAFIFTPVIQIILIKKKKFSQTKHGFCRDHDS